MQSIRLVGAPPAVAKAARGVTWQRSTVPSQSQSFEVVITAYLLGDGRRPLYDLDESRRSDALDSVTQSVVLDEVEPPRLFATIAPYIISNEDEIVPLGSLLDVSALLIAGGTTSSGRVPAMLSPPPVVAVMVYAHIGSIELSSHYNGTNSGVQHVTIESFSALFDRSTAVVVLGPSPEVAEVLALTQFRPAQDWNSGEGIVDRIVVDLYGGQVEIGAALDEVLPLADTIAVLQQAGAVLIGSSRSDVEVRSVEDPASLQWHPDDLVIDSMQPGCVAIQNLSCLRLASARLREQSSVQLHGIRVSDPDASIGGTNRMHRLQLHVSGCTLQLTWVRGIQSMPDGKAWTNLI